MPKLSWKQAAAWRVRRQHLHQRAPTGSMLAVANRLCGLHAQVMSSAELTAWARVEGLHRDAVRRLEARAATLPARSGGRGRPALGRDVARRGRLLGRFALLVRRAGDQLRREVLHARRDLLVQPLLESREPFLALLIFGSFLGGFCGRCSAWCRR